MAYTLQQNGLAERKSKTLVEMVNAMLSDYGLNNNFWGEAMLTVCYILNIMLHKKAKVSPYELWK